MRDRSFLSVIEQVVMVLVFALAAALCLRAFVFADQVSRSCEERDRAILSVQSAAETVKHFRGNLERAAGQLGGTVQDGVLLVRYDTDWQISEADGVFVLSVGAIDSGDDLLGCAAVCVRDSDGNEIFSVNVYWQEVGGNG